MRKIIMKYIYDFVFNNFYNDNEEKYVGMKKMV